MKTRLSLLTLSCIISAAPRAVTIGQYAYRLGQDGQVYRCKTDDVGREWIDANGNRFSAWQHVVRCDLK